MEFYMFKREVNNEIMWWGLIEMYNLFVDAAETLDLRSGGKKLSFDYRKH
jgi:hypothetical protein